MPSKEFFIECKVDILSNNFFVCELFINMHQIEAYNFQMDSFLILSAFINLNIKAFACLYTLKNELSKKRQKQLSEKVLACFYE